MDSSTVGRPPKADPPTIEEAAGAPTEWWVEDEYPYPTQTNLLINQFTGLDWL